MRNWVARAKGIHLNSGFEDVSVLTGKADAAQVSRAKEGKRTGSGQ